MTAKPTGKGLWQTQPRYTGTFSKRRAAKVWRIFDLSILVEARSDQYYRRLMEDYGTIESRFGRSAAVFWYYKFWRRSQNVCGGVFFKWGTIAAIGDWFRRHI
jgi:hypothetical protein